MAIWLAAAAAVGLWAALLAAFAVATRNPDVDPGPPANELADESPAVVDLITGNWRLCDEAASATLLDLAAKGAVQIEEIGPELSLVRLRHDPANLTPYEKLVYDHVKSLEKDGVVPTGALAEGSRNLSRWWRSFRRKVVVDARARGLSRARWSRAQAVVLTATAALPAGVIGVAVTMSDDKHEGGIGAAFLAFFLLAGLMGKLRGERGTALGAERAAYWLGVREHLAAGRFDEQPAASVTIWGRHLAYAAALGLAPRAVQSLPVSTPADDQRAWSDYGGMWHVVNVRYPRRIMWAREPFPMIGRALIAAMAIGMWTWIVLIVGAAFDVVPDGLPVPGAWVVALVVAAVPIFSAVTDLTSKAVVEGQVVRLRQYAVRSSGNHVKYAYWCAVDDGRQRDVKAYGIGAGHWSGLSEGDHVRLLVGRRLGWVDEAEVLGRSRPGGATEYSDTGEHTIDAPINLGEVPLLRRRDFDDPAALITPDDLRRTLGIVVGAPLAYDGALPIPSWLNVRSCRYRAEHGVVVDVHTATGLRSRYLMAMGAVLTRAQGRQVPGVGSNAMLHPGMVSAQTERGTFAINVSSPVGPPLPDLLIALARTAATRLG